MNHEEGEATKERRPISRWADNPIFIRLIREDRRFSVRAAIILAAVIGLVGLAGNVLWLGGIGLPDPDDALPVLVIKSVFLIAAPLAVMLGWFVLATCPIAVAATAASQTAADVRSEAFQLVRLTGLSDRQMMWGYSLAAFHRRRLMLALAVTLAPSAILGLAALMREASVYTTYARQLQPPSGMDVIGPLIEVTATVIGLLLLNVIGGSLGVRLALWAGQRRLMIGVVVMAVMIILSLSGITFMLTFLGPYVGGVRFSEFPSAWKELAIVVGLCAGLPFGLAAMLVWRVRGKSVS